MKHHSRYPGKWSQESGVIDKVEDEEMDRRELDTSWFRKGIRNQAGQHREPLGCGDYLQQAGSIFYEAWNGPVLGKTNSDHLGKTGLNYEKV